MMAGLGHVGDALQGLTAKSDDAMDVETEDAIGGEEEENSDKNEDEDDEAEPYFMLTHSGVAIMHRHSCATSHVPNGDECMKPSAPWLRKQPCGASAGQCSSAVLSGHPTVRDPASHSESVATLSKPLVSEHEPDMRVS